MNKIKVLKSSNNSYDFFFGEGWDNCLRVRVTKTNTYVYSRFGVYPRNFMNLIESHVKSQ